MKNIKKIMMVCMLGAMVISGCGNDDSDSDRKAKKDKDVKVTSATFDDNNEDYNADKDNSNEEIIENSAPKYHKEIMLNDNFEPEYVSGNLIVFSYSRKYGIMDKDQNIIIEPKMDYIPRAENGVVIAYTEDETHIVNSQCEKYKVEMGDGFEIVEYAILENSNVNMSLYNKDTMEYIFRIYDNKGNIIKEIKEKGYEKEEKDKVINELKFSNGSGVCGYHVAVTDYSESWSGEKTDTLVLYDDEGNKIKEYIGCEKLSDIYKKDKDDKNIYAENDFTDGMALIESGEHYGYGDVNGNIVIKPEYEELGKPGEGLIPYSNYGKWGYLDYKGNVVIEAKYDKAGQFNCGLAPVIIGSTLTYIDKDNNVKNTIELGEDYADYVKKIEDYEYSDSGNAFVEYDYYSEPKFMEIPVYSNKIIGIDGEEKMDVSEYPTSLCYKLDENDMNSDLSYVIGYEITKNDDIYGSEYKQNKVLLRKEE